MYIYRIYNLSDQCYIGSTTCGLKRRWQQHKSDYKRCKAGKGKKCGSYELFDKYGVNNLFYELIEIVEKESQLLSRERYWIEFYGENAVNKYRPVITEEELKEYKKEWYENNKEQLLKQKKEYRENNREEIAKRMKEKYTCECGSTLRKAEKARHERSIKHQSFLQTKE